MVAKKNLPWLGFIVLSLFQLSLEGANSCETVGGMITNGICQPAEMIMNAAESNVARDNLIQAYEDEVSTWRGLWRECEKNRGEDFREALSSRWQEIQKVRDGYKPAMSAMALVTSAANFYYFPYRSFYEKCVTAQPYSLDGLLDTLSSMSCLGAIVTQADSLMTSSPAESILAAHVSSLCILAAHNFDYTARLYKVGAFGKAWKRMRGVAE